MTDPYAQLLNAQFAADYQTPDWYKVSGLALNQTPENTRAFFAANPQYAQDWQNITSGGKSAFSTDGSGLIKSSFANMPSNVADYYSNNTAELLAAEGFGHDPTLAYMAYHNGPSSIGINPETTNISSYLRGNKWTPDGVVASNNPLALSGMAWGGGGGARSAANAQQYGSTRPMTTQQAFGGSSGGGGASMSSTFQQNPYAGQMANTLSQQMGEQFQRQITPQIASGAQLAGGYGGSRQAVMEANAANDLQQNTGQAVGTLLGNLYGQDLSYNLGMGNIGLGYANLDRSIANDNNQWGLQGAQLGMQLQDRQLQQNQLGLGLGSQIQNNPYNQLNQYGGLYNQIGQGFGSQTQSGGGGNPLMGAIGGAQLGGQFGNWWNSQGSGNNYGVGNPNNMFNGVDVSPWSFG